MKLVNYHSKDGWEEFTFQPNGEDSPFYVDRLDVFEGSRTLEIEKVKIKNMPLSEAIEKLTEAAKVFDGDLKVTADSWEEMVLKGMRLLTDKEIELYSELRAQLPTYLPEIEARQERKKFLKEEIDKMNDELGKLWRFG